MTQYAMSTYLEQAVLNASLRGLAFTPPSTIYIALFTNDPTDEDTGTEVVGGGYARQVATFTEPQKETDKSECENASNIDFGTAASDWGTITHVGLYDTVTGGNLLLHGGLTNPKTIQANDRAIYYPADLKVRLG